MSKPRTDGRTKAGRESITDVVTSDLRALLFWANIGVAKSTAGSYGADINSIIQSYATYLHFTLPYPLGFDAFRLKTLARRSRRKHAD